MGKVIYVAKDKELNDYFQDLAEKAGVEYESITELKNAYEYIMTDETKQAIGDYIRKRDGITA